MGKSGFGAAEKIREWDCGWLLPGEAIGKALYFVMLVCSFERLCLHLFEANWNLGYCDNPFKVCSTVCSKTISS